MSEKGKAMRLSGKTLSPGLGEGKTFLYRDVLTRLDKFYDINDSQIDEELKRLKRAVERSTDDLNVLASRVKKEMDFGSFCCVPRARCHAAGPEVDDRDRKGNQR